MVVTFLLMGGGIFGFLIWQGLQDMQDVKFRSFGSGITARATLPILKHFGFVDNETPEGAASAERRLAREESMGSASAEHPPDGDELSHGRPTASGRTAGRGQVSSGPASRIASSLSGAGAIGGGGGSKSFSSFSGLGGAGGLKLSGKSGAADPGPKGGKTMDALVASGRHLASAANTNSALSAKSKWDQGFGMKHAQGGAGGQLSSYNKAAASLDHIETGEVGNLKMGDPSTLDVPDVGKPKPVPTSESIADKMKEAAKKNMGNEIARAMLGALPTPSNSGSSGPAGGESSAPTMPPGMQDYINGGIMEGDRQYATTPVQCKQNCPGNLKEGDYYWDVTFTGTGTDGTPYTETCSVFKSGGAFDGKCF